MHAPAAELEPHPAAATDHELLARYVREGAHDAFATLVERYVAMVYAAARRSLGPYDQGDAEDVAQAVFILLARKAATIRPDRTSLASWLYHAARLTAANARRDAGRRRRHEQQAGETMRQHLASLSSPSASSSTAAPLVWAEIEERLDDALARLRPHDREALVLRFLASRSLRDVGDAVGISEDAARVRVNRALERLRRLMGVGAPAVALTAALDAGVAHAATTVPAQLASSVTATALAPAAGSSAAAALAAATATTMTSATVKTVAAVVMSAIVVLSAAGGAGVMLMQRSARPPSTATATASPTTIAANTPRGVTLAVLRAAAAGDRAGARRLMHIRGEAAERAADAGVELLVAEGRFDATVAARFPDAGGTTRIGDKIALIAATTESVTGGRATLVFPSGPPLPAFALVDGQWKMLPTAVVLESEPPDMLEQRLKGTKALRKAIDLTAAEIDAGQYPTRTDAIEVLARRVGVLFPVLATQPGDRATAAATATATTLPAVTPAAEPRGR